MTETPRPNTMNNINEIKKDCERLISKMDFNLSEPEKADILNAMIRDFPRFETPKSIWDYEYDNEGRLIITRLDGEIVEKKTYGDYGYIITESFIRNGKNVTRTTKTEKNGKPICTSVIHDSVHELITYNYNEIGILESISRNTFNGDGNVIIETYKYYSTGELWQVAESNGSLTEYDIRGNIILTYEDDLEILTIFAYNEFDNIIYKKVMDYGVTEEGQRTYQYIYNEKNLCIEKRILETSFLEKRYYDEQDRPFFNYDNEGFSEGFGYNENGDLWLHTKLLNRNGISTATGEFSKYEYNDDGKVACKKVSSVIEKTIEEPSSQEEI